MHFDARQKRLALACLAAAFILPLLSAGDDSGGYVAGVGRYLLVGGIVVAVVPRLERWRARQAGTTTGAAGNGAAPARAGNPPGAAVKGRAWSAGTQQVATVAISSEDAFDRALQAVKGLKRGSVSSADAGTGLIVARIGPTLRSIGELVEVRVEAAGDGRVQVDVYSKARVSLTSSDRLKAEENVVKILQAVQGP